MLPIVTEDDFEDGGAYYDTPVYNKPVKLMGPLADAMAEIHGHFKKVPYMRDGEIWHKMRRDDLPAPILRGYDRTWCRWMKTENGEVVPR